MDRAAADRVQQIREYLSKMTPGPWTIEEDGGDVHVRDASGESLACDMQYYPWTFGCDDSAGIAALRTDAEWLLSQLSASEERVRWISVKDRTPELDARVLCGADGTSKKNDCPWVAIGYYKGVVHGDFTFYDDEAYLCGTTHWMPLPAPPPVAKEDK